MNDGRDDSKILPEKYKPFFEYDIYPKNSYSNHGLERIVIGKGSGGAVWYTRDHYHTFIRMFDR